MLFDVVLSSAIATAEASSRFAQTKYSTIVQHVEDLQSDSVVSIRVLDLGSKA